MFTIGSTPRDPVPYGHGSGRYTNDDVHLQCGGAGLTDDELAQLAVREVLLILDDAVACRDAQMPRPSSLDSFLSNMQCKGYSHAVDSGSNPLPKGVYGSAPWRKRGYRNDTPNDAATENTSAPPTSCDGGGTRKTIL